MLLVVSMLVSSVQLFAMPASSDPWYGDDGDMSRVVSWNFTDPLDYSVENTSVSEGLGQLFLHNDTVGESTTANFQNGTCTNVDLQTIPDEMTIGDLSLPVTRLVLQPGPEGKDNFIDEWFSGWTYPEGSDLDVNSQFDPTQIDNKRCRIIMEFNLSLVPAGATVLDAILFLYEKPCKALPLSYSIHSVNSSWVEHPYPNVCWNMRDAAHGWTRVGGDYSTEIFAAGTIDGINGWHQFDLTRLVDLWTRGLIPNCGFIMKESSTTLEDTTKSFTDCESSKVEQRPKLIINYTLGMAFGSYESRALGEGLNSTFTLANWSNETYSKATDEFNSGNLSQKWHWLSDPRLSGGSLDINISGWLNVTGSQPSNLSAGVNYLYQNITGNFDFVTSLQERFAAAAMGAGILIRNDDLSWLALYKTGVQGTGLIVAELKNGSKSTILGSRPWPNSSAFLRMERDGTTYSMFASQDGIGWTLIATQTPKYDFTRRVALGLCLFSGGSTTGPVAEFDFVRVQPLGQQLSIEVRARTGNSTLLSDPSWTSWTGALVPSSGTVIGGVGRYLQYQVALNTSYDWLSPSFTGFECYHERYAQTGTIVTGDVSPLALAMWQTLVATHSTAYGRIEYAYSTDHGSTWVNLGSGTTFNIPLAQPSLMVRVSLTTYDTLSTPSVDAIDLTYTITHARFYVSAPQTVVAGQEFSLLIEPKDTDNYTTTWRGTVTIAARDASGVFSASSELAVTSGDVPLGGRLTITNERYDFAETITIFVSGGGETGISSQINVVPGPIDHIVMTPNVTALPEDNSTVFTASGYDALGNVITNSPIAWHADLSLGVLNATTGSSVTLMTSTYVSGGYLNVTIQGMTVSRYIEVGPVNFPPEIDPVLPTQTRTEDYGSWALDLSPYVSDPEDNVTQLKWYIVNESLVSIIGENRTGNMIVTFTTILNLYGTDVLEVRVVDSDRLMSRASITVEITPVNDAPTMDPIEPLVVRYDEPYTYDLRYYVHDVEGPMEDLILSVDSASASYVHVDQLWLTFVYPISLNGTQQTVVVTVSDGQFTDSTIILVTVTGDYVPRNRGSLPNLVMNQGESRIGYFDLDDYFTDPDGDVLIYAYGNTHVSVMIQANHTVDFYAPRTWYGEEYIVFRAVDSFGARAESAMLVTIVPVNQPPVIKGVPDLVVRYGQQYILDLAPYVSDLDEDPNELSIMTNDIHAWADGLLLTLAYPAGMTGLRVSLNITVSDDVLSDWWRINVTISTDNPPEVIMPAPEHSFHEDDPKSYPTAGHINDFFADPDDDPLTFVAFVSTPNMTAEAVIDDGNWTVSFHPDENWFGLTNLTLRAIDGAGALAETTVLLAVISVGDKPILSLPDSFSVTQGSQTILDISGDIFDPDSKMDDFRFEVAAEYADFVGVHNGVVVFKFPNGYLGEDEESRAVSISITVFDQDNLFSTDTIVVTVTKVTVPTPADNPILWLALVGCAAAASVFFVFAVIRRKKPFVIRDMMLIHNDGFLIGRHATPVPGEIDEHVLSGMLTAVLNFVEDSMATQHGSLTTFGFREYQVLVHRGERVFSAVVFEGDQPDDVGTKLNDFIKKFEKIYKNKLVEWSGDIETDFAGADVLIRSWVAENSRKAKEGRKGMPWKVFSKGPEQDVGDQTAK